MWRLEVVKRLLETTRKVLHHVCLNASPSLVGVWRRVGVAGGRAGGSAGGEGRHARPHLSIGPDEIILATSAARWTVFTLRGCTLLTHLLPPSGRVMSFSSECWCVWRLFARWSVSISGLFECLLYCTFECAIGLFVCLFLILSIRLCIHGFF